MSDDMARLRDEVAGVLAEPLCQRICDMAGEPRLFVPGEVEAMLRETADALLPLLARVRDDARCPLTEHDGTHGPLIRQAKAEALREAADAYDPATEHQARGWVKGWLLDRAEAAGGQNEPLRGQGGPNAPSGDSLDPDEETRPL